jgi:hypothetical protein
MEQNSKTLFILKRIDLLDLLFSLVFFVSILVVWLFYCLIIMPITFPLLITLFALILMFGKALPTIRLIKNNEYLKFLFFKTDKSLVNYKKECISKLYKLVAKTPLNNIKGECRFVFSGDEDFGIINKDLFNGKNIKIIFSVNKKVVGVLVPEVGEADYCMTYDEQDIRYCIKLSYLIKGDILSILIKCSNQCPDSAQFGEFIAYTD